MKNIPFMNAYLLIVFAILLFHPCMFAWFAEAFFRGEFTEGLIFGLITSGLLIFGSVGVVGLIRGEAPSKNLAVTITGKSALFWNVVWTLFSFGVIIYLMIHYIF